MTHRRAGLPPKALVAALAAWLLLIAAALPSSAQTVERPSGWTDESHGNRVPANYDLVLPNDRINELFITFTPESWAAEEADMIDIYGERGTGEDGGFGGRGGFGRLFPPDIAELAAQLDRSEEAVQVAFALLPDFAAAAERLEMKTDELFEALGIPSGFRPRAGEGRAGFPAGGPGEAGNAPGGPGGAFGSGRLDLAGRNPIWVPVTIKLGGEIWFDVGFRYKGNSTLSLGWRSGNIALPFKLDFDEFEDDHPELQNQRFYGFKQLSFANNDLDPSTQREKVTADIFRDAGVPAAETAYYAVYVDNGESDGYEFWGIYTAIELPDDTLIETQFADDNGNMYKPSGRGATFAAGSFSQPSFDKETNGDSGYDDVLAVFDALHAETRLSDPAAWRANLEAVFDVAGFLRWLAANTLIQNWDTYGVMSHNYYLYADESTGQLVWIPWDNNMALSSTMGGRGRDSAADPAEPGEGEQPAFPAPGGRGVLSLEMDDVDGERWPLIGYLMDQPQYHQLYIDEVERISEEIFTPARMTAIYEADFALLSAYIGAKEGDQAVADLRQATDELVAHVQERAVAAQAYLLEQTAD